MANNNMVNNLSMFGDLDVYLIKEGNYFRAFDKFGAHLMSVDGVEGTYFAVSAPSAKNVSVVGDFNSWDVFSHPLSPRSDGSGVWDGFIPGVGKGLLYKYHVVSQYNNYQANKSDPFALYCEIPPKTASVVWDLNYDWHDQAWISERPKRNSHGAPISIYEVHLGSWHRGSGGKEKRFFSYGELAPELASYINEMGFTHVEFMPVMEHPYYPSWGYQVTGYFAPTSRYGSPQDFMYLVDYLHQQGIGVILDWVPSHFPADEHGLAYFDGTYLYEHADPRKGFHPEWKSHIFNYGRSEVRNFLISNALFWLEKYHIDGLRVDAVASMLYLDYARNDGQWVPNEYGGRDNTDAINFLKRLNEVVYACHPDVQIIAEESTAWPMVSRPIQDGGLGFGMKWNMGWMHDTLVYFSKNPIHRKHHHNQLTFSLLYAFLENFVLPFSHDEVVHGKGSLLTKMPGDDWQKFANLRLLLGYLYSHPGKKLLFMGCEFGQRKEWSHEVSLEWNLLQYPAHQGIQRWVRDLNYLYKSEPALHEQDFDSKGFKWVNNHSWEISFLSFMRRGRPGRNLILVVCNFTPVVRYNFKAGVPAAGLWKEVLNSDAKEYGGSGQGNFGAVESVPEKADGFEHSISLRIPPLAVIIFRKEIVEDIAGPEADDKSVEGNSF